MIYSSANFRDETSYKSEKWNFLVSSARAKSSQMLFDFRSVVQSQSGRKYTFCKYYLLVSTDDKI